MIKNITGRSKRIAIGALQNASGYPMPNIPEEYMGFTRSELSDLFYAILKEEEHNLNSREFAMIKMSLRVCLKYIDDWEFPAVFDVDITKADVQKFYDEYFSDTP